MFLTKKDLKMAQILNSISIFGDSILKGVVFDEIMGKYRQVKKSATEMFSSSKNVPVNNYSRFGNTSDRMLTKIDFLLENDKSNVVLLELGGNDCDFNWDKIAENPKGHHIENVAYSKFKKNINTIIDKIIGAKKDPIIMTLPPIDSERYFNWVAKNDGERAKNIMSFLGDKTKIYRNQELYAGALERIGYDRGLHIINVRESLLSIPKYSDYLCLDGIHLNEKGQKLVKKVFDQKYKELILNQ